MAMRSQHLTLSLLALIAALLPAGCADQDPSLLLTGYYFATGKATEDGSGVENCVYPSSAGGDVLVSQDATINLQELRDGITGRPNAFVFGSIIENRLQSNATSGGKSLRLDTNSVTVKSADIRFLFDSPVLLPRAFAVTIPPNGSSSLAIPLINSADEVSKIAAEVTALSGDKGTVTVIAEITVKGTLLDGTDVESNILEFPVNLCNKCDTALLTTPTCLPE
jgi:hypothetical protein